MHTQCVIVSLLIDGLIEETEIVALSVEIVDGALGINDVVPDTANITITDGDG